MFWTCLETVMTVDTIPHPGKNYNYASETLSPYSKIKTSFQCPPDLQLICCPLQMDLQTEQRPIS